LKGEKLEGLQEKYQAFDEVCLVASGKYRRYHGQSFLAHLIDVKTLLLNIRDFFRVSRGIFSAKRQLKRIKPDVVFSKGSYAAVPVGIAAHRLGIPIITHDSDAVPGLANRILARWAVVHAVGQPVENYDYPKGKLVFTGIPVDEHIKPVSEAQQRTFKRELALPEDSLVLLVAGGGLGSGYMNDLISKTAPELLKQQPRLRIIIIAGQQHQAEASEAYQRMPEAEGRVSVLGFTPDFYKYSGAADLILCRAGASTLAEFALQRKPIVVVPAAHLTGGHQLANVKQLQELVAAEVLDSQVTPEELLKVLNQLLQNKRGREALGDKLGTLAQPQAAEKLAQLILHVAESGVGT